MTFIQVTMETLISFCILGSLPCVKAQCLGGKKRGLNNTHEICSECLMEMMLSSPLQKSPDLQHVCICSLVLCATTELNFVPQGCAIFMVCIHT